MRTLYWFLGAAAAALGTAYLAKRGKRRPHQAAQRFLQEVLTALASGRLDMLMNHTPIRADGWTDEYAGSLAGQPLLFFVNVKTENGVEPPGHPRFYHLKWGERWVQALAPPSVADEPRHGFERLHDALRDWHQRLSGKAPS